MYNEAGQDIGKVRGIKNVVEAWLLKRPIRVYVKRKQDVPEAETIPKEIRGVPTTDAIEPFCLTLKRGK